MIDDDVVLTADALTAFGTRILSAIGCSGDVAQEVAAHLVDADLRGIYSHGIVRLTQYAEHARDGRFNPDANCRAIQADGGGPLIDGGNGFGIPAMRLAVERAIEDAKKNGTGAVGVVNVAHTGHNDVYVERAANAGCLAIILGGGSRAEWRQVVPYGGAKAMLPTNPYAMAIPGGERGPVVLDFATSAGAGGKVYAAKSAGRPLAPGLCVDKDGYPTTNPDDYFNGGGLLPMAGPKGYGMALIGELLGEAMFGEAMDGLNWVVVCLDLSRFRKNSAYHVAAEQCLDELRNCPPAPGIARVEIPGERERAQRDDRLKNGIPLPIGVVNELRESAKLLGIGAPELAVTSQS